MSEELKPCPTEALEALRNQKQLDMDGCMVGVSRQALDEVLDYVKSSALLSSPDARREALEEAAKVAERVAVYQSPSAEYACQNIARRIRALKETKP